MRRTLALLALLSGGCPSGDEDGPRTPLDTDPEEHDPPESDVVESDPPPTDVETDAPDTDAGPRTTVELGPEVRCEHPVPLAYDPLDPGGAWADQPVFPGLPAWYAGGGVAVADVDDDGVLDVLRTSAGDGFRWYALGPEGAVDRTSELPPIPAGTAAVVPVDVEGDGDLDLHVVVWQGPDLLLRRTPEGWTDVADALGLAGPAEEHSASAAWGDADGDGDLDVFVAGYGALPAAVDEPIQPGDASRLLLQQADGTFVDVVPSVPVRHALRQAHTFLGSWVQLDADAAQELYVLDDFGWRWSNFAVEVAGGAVVDLGPYGFEGETTSMGLGLGDLNGDGRDELVVPAIDHILFYVSTASGWFSAAESVGLVPARARGQVVGWGAELADLDHDADLDALVAYGHLDDFSLPSSVRKEHDAVFVRDAGRFVDRADDLGLDQDGVGRGFVVADVDGDGWLDVVKQDLWGPTTIHRARCGDGAWLEVALRQEGPNPRAVGARVVAIDGGAVISGTVRAGGTSYASAGPAAVHLGLGDRDAIERLEVHWPDGAVDVTTDVPTRRAIRVIRGEAPGSLGGSP